MEERVGFEPTALDESPVFKTGSFNHSDISPDVCSSAQLTKIIIAEHIPFVNTFFEKN